MKKYIVLILSLFFGIGFVNAANVSFSPITAYFGEVGAGNVVQNNLQVVVDGGSYYNYAISPRAGSWNKIALSYDLSSIQEDYITFIVKSDAITGQGVADIDGNVCEAQTTSVDYSSTARPSFGFVCKNSKKSLAYFNWYIGYQGGGNYSINVYVLQEHGVYNDLLTAKISNIEQLQQQQNQFIQNSDTTGANTGYGSVFNESVADTTGTTALFNVLQNFISNLGSNDTCSSFSIPIPFLNSQNVVLPCMRSVYTQHFGLIYNLVQIILSAIIFYWCVVNVLKLFKETLDPFNYKLEVLDL